MLCDKTKHHLRQIKLTYEHRYVCDVDHNPTGDKTWKRAISAAKRFGGSPELERLSCDPNIDRLFLNATLTVWGRDDYGFGHQIPMQKDYVKLYDCLRPESRGTSIDEPSPSIKKLLDITHPDMTHLLCTTGAYPLSWTPDIDVCVAYANTCLSNPEVLQMAVIEKVDYHIMLRGAADIDAAFEILDKTKTYGHQLFYDYLSERLDRGLSIDSFKREIPPTNKLWRRLQVTKDFLETLPTVKRFKFLMSCTEKVPISHEDVKQLVFPIINNPKYKDDVKNVLEKYENRDEKYGVLANILYNEPRAVYGHLGRISSIDMPNIISFFSWQWSEQQAKDVLVKFLDHIYQSSPNGARPFVLEAYNAIIKKEGGKNG